MNVGVDVVVSVEDHGIAKLNISNIRTKIRSTMHLSVISYSYLGISIFSVPRHQNIVL